MTKDHHEKRTGGHRSFSVASLLVLLFVASLVLAVAKSIAGTGFKSIYPLGFVAAFTSLWFLAAMARRRGWPPMTALAIGLHLHPFGCWIVQQKLAEYLESLMALRYALVLVPAILVICISFLIPAAPRSWAARRQCPDESTCVAPVSRSTSWRSCGSCFRSTGFHPIGCIFARR